MKKEIFFFWVVVQRTALVPPCRWFYHPAFNVFQACLKKAGVTVFQQKSRADNMILEILPSGVEQVTIHDITVYIL